VLSHMARKLPPEPKREGIKESQILLAFPMTEDLEPKLEPQNVYAFLPIRDYGLQVCYGTAFASILLINM